MGSSIFWLQHFLAHEPISKHAPQLKFKRTEVHCNIDDLGAPVLSIIS